MQSHMITHTDCTTIVAFTEGLRCFATFMMTLLLLYIQYMSHGINTIWHYNFTIQSCAKMTDMYGRRKKLQVYNPGKFSRIVSLNIQSILKQTDNWEYKVLVSSNSWGRGGEGRRGQGRGKDYKILLVYGNQNYCTQFEVIQRNWRKPENFQNA